MGFLRRALVPGVVALAVLAGCSGNEYRGPKVATMLTGGPPPAANANMSDEDRVRAFEQCMRDNGADVSGLKENQSQPSEEQMNKIQEASEKCREHLPNAGQPPPLDAKQIDELRKQAQCLRDRGLEAKDPTPDRPFVDFGDINFESEQVRKAMEECMNVPKVGVAEPEPTR